jgi:glycosyltransferase involved in cell wall biosynthesis
MTRSAVDLVSIIIPAHNAAEFLGAQLRSLCDQDYDGSFEVIVADNGSSDGTVEVASQFASRLNLRVIDASAEPGAGPARNAGYEVARGELLVFADADDVAATDWLGHLISAAREWDFVAGPYEYVTLNSPEVKDWRRHQPADKLPTVLGFLPYALGGNFAVWRDIFSSVGGFRTGRSNDVEFSWRMQLAGYRLGFTPDAVMCHRHRSTLRAHAKQSEQWGISHCRLYREFRSQGIQRDNVVRATLRLGKCVAIGPKLLVDRSRRGWWIGAISYRVGRVHGSIRYRVLFF